MYILLSIPFIIYALCGFKIVRPTERGVVETLGKYSRPASMGLNYLFPWFQKLIRVNITEAMSDMGTQEIITEDNLNAEVDLVVYYKINSDPESVKNALYNVSDIFSQLVMLARTTARNIIGTMKFAEVNSKRTELNVKLANMLREETSKWGVEIVRVELKDITPPESVQETMNQVIKAENTKRAAIDYATARETEADGLSRASIKKAEGVRQAVILEAEAGKQAEILKAEGQAKAFEMINKSFSGNAQLLRRLEVTENSLKNNSKVVLTKDGISPQIILGDLPVK